MKHQFEQCMESVTKKAMGVLTVRSRTLAGWTDDAIGGYVAGAVREVLQTMKGPTVPDEEELLRAVCVSAWRKMCEDAGVGQAH